MAAGKGIIKGFPNLLDRWVGTHLITRLGAAQVAVSVASERGRMLKTQSFRQISGIWTYLRDCRARFFIDTTS